MRSHFTSDQVDKDTSNEVVNVLAPKPATTTFIENCETNSDNNLRHGLQHDPKSKQSKLLFNDKRNCNIHRERSSSNST